MIVGITNMPEFGILPTTEPRHTGADPQPVGHRRARRAAPPAARRRRWRAGMLPVAHGNDGGGSMRIPASCCGLVGLKPSRGRVSRGPDLGDSFLASDGVLTRTVAETALLLDVLVGLRGRRRDVGAAARRAVHAGDPPRPGRLRIAMSAANALDADVDPECRARDARDRRAARRARPPGRGGRAVAARARTCCASSAACSGPAVALGVAYGEQLAGRPPEDDEIEPLSRALCELAPRA